jgi:hypothetical protein
MNPYRLLLQPDTPKACESSSKDQLLRERHLHAVWAEQKWFTPLTTISGKSIEVISPGIWNSGPGPDFLKAHLEIDGITVFGDIEIHFRDDAWERHGHHEDARYNNVILHVSLTEEITPHPLKKQDGSAIEQTYLEKKLTVSLTELTQQIDLDQYPYKEYLGSGTCAHALFHDLGEDKIDLFFHKAALWRMTQKYEQLNSYVDDSAEILIAGICQALGFKQNGAPFLQLYRHSYALNIHDETEMFPFLMQVTGFFDDKFQRLWGHHSYYQRLTKLMKPEITTRIPLNFVQVRPLNHPLRRLVYLSKFLTDPNRYTIQTKLMNLWDTYEQIHESHFDSKKFMKELKALIPSYTDSHFEKSLFFEEPVSSKKLGLMGEETKNEILLNVFIPFLNGVMNKSTDEGKISVLLKAFPIRSSGKFNYLTHRFFGQTNKKNMMCRGDLQQGSYQLHKDFCQHYESSCQGCPFVKRFKSFFE